MPGLVLQEGVKLSSLPNDVLKKLEKLENEMQSENIEKKEYCDQKWAILKPHVDENVVEQIQELQTNLEANNDLDDYCSEVMRILQVNLQIHSPVKSSGSVVTSPKTSSPRTYGRQSRTPKTKPKLESDDQVAGPSRTPSSAAKKLAAFKSSPRNGNAENGGSAKNESIKRKSTVVDNEDQEPGPSSSRSAAKKLAVEKEENNVNGDTAKGSGRKSAGKQATQKNTLSSWVKKGSTGNGLTNGSSNVSDNVEVKSETKSEEEDKNNEESPKALPEDKDKCEEEIKTDPEEDKVVEEQKDAEDEVEEEEQQPAKKIKQESENEEAVIEDSDSKPVEKSVTKGGAAKCEICRQLLSDSDLRLYSGHPHNAVEEFIALTDPRLSLFTGEENNIDEHDERPQNKVTQFSVYDKAGHLCPIDGGLIERNVLLYFSGFMKPIYEENADAEGGIPVKDLGPINEWWVSGFDGGERALIGFSTAFGEYYLMEPSEAYAPLMESVKEKIYMGKLVIEFLLDEENATYEDLLNKLQTTVPPFGTTTLTEDSLLRHAQFICDQVLSFDTGADSSDDLLITTPCMRALVKLAGVTFGKRRAMRRTEKKDFKQKKAEWSKATTTPLVSDVFETFFTDQLDSDATSKGPKRRRCGVCEACQLPDCGTCPACADMIKFGGTGRSKQACVKRRCPNMAIQEADDDEAEEEENADEILGEDTSSNMSWTSCHRNVQLKEEKKVVEWVGEPVKDDGRKVYYSKAKVGEEEISIGDCVTVEPNDPKIPVFIGRIVYMWQDKNKEKHFHARWFCRGSDTMLGETSDPQELFVIDECEDSLLSVVGCKASVNMVDMPADWATLGGRPLSELTVNVGPDDGKSFFCQKRYDPLHGRFEDIPQDLPCSKPETLYRFCPCCERLYQQQKKDTPSVDEKFDELGPNKEIVYGVVRWKGEEYRAGTFVFLTPGVFKFKSGVAPVFNKGPGKKEEKVDEELYPEYYRKSSDHVKGSNVTTPEPFCIGYITAVVTKSKDKLVASGDICLRVKKMYRPENTHREASLSHQLDLNQIYWTDDELIVNFADVAGRCFVTYGENVENMTLAEWSAGGPFRFYFNKAYDSSNQSFVDPPSHATLIGSQGKGKGKGKGKSSSVKQEEKKDSVISYPKAEPLRCLDVFAGCGGLSEGLHQAGVADSKWAIEKEESAAHAFRLNNSKTTVFTEDCNLLLKLTMNGEKYNMKGQLLPQKGEVELLCGGPPCQGFSGMNRFNSRQYSLFKNSLIVSYLSYCDYYRPRFFILENVRNFVSFKRSMVLKLTMRCLVRMGYQCTFGVLQAGNYGVPQTRRRAIIIAAAPGEILPNYPEPTHTFNPRATALTIMVDDKKFSTKCQWVDSAPLRTITVRDAMSDLPEIRNGAKQDEMPYGGEPESHFQRQMRGNQYQPVCRDHICKEMAPLVEARMANIPTKAGSDWRDLPNIAVRLSDGNFSKKLQYTHHDKKNGKSSSGALRGVCSCATGKPCDPMDRQYNTLIPWCLPHTGNRHNHWSGLYGRVEWDGFFSTTVTNPEPMGKQGRVLHPTQTRVVSVRECARSQGFPDTYRFFGGILDKHRQIGNAVPPPMGKAIGLEILKCVATKPSQKNEMDVE